MGDMTSLELAKFLFAIGVMLVFARLLGKICQKINVSSLVTEIIAGILLGPTLLGALLPQVYNFFFPHAGRLPSAYNALTNLSAIMLLFLIGADIDLDRLSKQIKKIIVLSIFGILVPLFCGFFFAWIFFDFFRGVDISAAPLIFPMIFAMILTSSSPTVIARILMTYDMLNSTLGIILLGAAMVAELICWLLFSSIMVYVNAAESNLQIFKTLFYILAFFIVVFLVSSQKKLMKKIFTENKMNKDEGKGVTMTSVVSYDISMLFGICLLTAAYTTAIEVHSAVGALIAGIVCRKIIGTDTNLLDQMGVFILNFFAPLFFISIGLQLDFASNFNLPIVLAVFVIACASKIIGSYLGATFSGFRGRESAGIAFGFSARGVAEIIISTLLLRMQLIGPQFFVAIIVASVASIFVAEYGLVFALKLKK